MLDKDKASRRISRIKYNDKLPITNPKRWLLRKAQSSKHICTITIEDIHIPDKCPYLQQPFDFTGKGSPWTPTLDRIDSTKGYIKGNIQVLSWKANAMKSNATKEELILFAKAILDNV